MAGDDAKSQKLRRVLSPLQSGAVTIPNRHGMVATEIDKTGRAQAALRRFYAMGHFRILTGHLLLAIHKDRVDLRPIDGIATDRVPADTTVLVTFRDAFRELFEEREDRGPQVFVVGDAVAPRDLQLAIREGHLAARSIDCPGIEPLWNSM